MPQKITPFLWFNDAAEEAARFYVSLFPESSVGTVSRYDEAGAKASGRPKGSAMVVPFTLAGLTISALNGGPAFVFNPSVSFYISLNDEKATDRLWQQLSDGGSALMELDTYPFSKKYGWVKDRFGLTWQLNMTGEPLKITPFLMFCGQAQGNAEAAMRHYTSLFPDSGITNIVRYGKDQGPEGQVVHAVFQLAGQEFMSLDSGVEHKFTFNEAFSLEVSCKDQAEIDRYWQALSDGGEEGQCGWIKDKFGLSWQIVPVNLGQYVSGPDRAGSGRAMQALLQMKKLDLNVLKQAYAHA